MDEVSITATCPGTNCGRQYAINRYNTIRRESGYSMFDCFEIACDPVACPGFVYVFYIDCAPQMRAALLGLTEQVYDEIPMMRIVDEFRRRHDDIAIPGPRPLANDDYRALRTFRRAINGSDGRLTRFLTS